ncbi:MAG: hypothetical protein AAF270_01515 [Pseudomonadota bacterium]
MNRTIKTKTLAAGLILAMASLPAVSETTLDYQLETGVAHTNNINRGPVDGADETVGIIGGELDWTVDTRRADGLIDATLEHRIFSNDTNDDETLLSLNGEFDFELIDRLLSWQVTDNFGQVLQDVFAPDNPQNRENVNVFSTGPVVSLPLNSTNQIQFVAAYRDVSFEESPQDNDSLSGQLSYQRSISETRTISLNLSSQALDFDRAIDPDFDRHSATVSFNSRTSRSNLEIEVGSNTVDFGSDREESDGALFRLNFTRNLTSRLSLTLGADQELSDTGQLFGQFLNTRTPNLFGENTADVEAEADALEQRGANIGLSAQQRNGSVFANIRYLDVDFQSSDDQDREGLTFSAGINREFAGGWRVGLNANLNAQDFVDGREDDNLLVSLNVTRQLTRTLALDARLTHTERDSTDTLFSFDEDALRVTLLWQPQRTRSRR